MIAQLMDPAEPVEKAFAPCSAPKSEARDEFIDALGIRTLILCRSSQERISRISVAR